MRSHTIALLLAVALFPGTWVGAQCAEERRAAATAAYTSKDYAGALTLIEDAIARGLEDASTHYDAACNAALGGRKDRAFAHLESALALGYANCTHLRQDPDLESLRSDPAWTRLVSRCDAAQAVVASFWDGAAWKTPFAEDLPTADKVAGLSRIWSEAKFNFANFALVPDLDWDRAYRDAIPKVLATKSTATYYQVLEEFVALLHDGHSFVQVPRELRPRLESWPALTTRVVEGRILVGKVLDPKLAEAGIGAGMEITAVDGVPVREFAATQVRARVAASTPQDLEMKVFEKHLLDGPLGTPVKLTLADAAGRASTHSVPRLAPADRMKLFGQNPFVVIERLPDGLLHVTIRSFNDEKVVPEFEQVFGEISKAKGLVLDVRGNGGGNSQHGDRILTLLTRGTYPSQRWWTRDYRPAMRAWGMPEARYLRTEQLEGQAAKAFAGPVVLLIGPRTYSAAEDFVAAFRAAQRGPIVGETTGGSTGQPLRFPLPGGGSGSVCTKRNTLSDGTEYIGVGIVPDVTVPTTFADVRAGRDRVLEAAVKILRSSGDGRPATGSGSSAGTPGTRPTIPRSR